MGQQPFQFKQFTVEQDRCAMKIGTDAVLLGAWSKVTPHTQSILDIGAGSGVLALMLAQRSDAELIDALEIDEEAYEQCVQNFENSPWSDRLFCYHASLQEFVEEVDDQYEFIVSNPPFFSEAQKSSTHQRDLARFQEAMPFDQLLWAVSKLLTNSGRFTVVIPFNEEDRLVALAQKFQLFTNLILHVKGTPESPVKRSYLEFSFHKTQRLTEELIIETKRHKFTQEYIELTKDFYLKF